MTVSSRGKPGAFWSQVGLGFDLSCFDPARGLIWVGWVWVVSLARGKRVWQCGVDAAEEGSSRRMGSDEGSAVREMDQQLKTTRDRLKSFHSSKHRTRSKSFHQRTNSNSFGSTNSSRSAISTPADASYPRFPTWPNSHSSHPPEMCRLTHSEQANSTRATSRNGKSLPNHPETTSTLAVDGVKKRNG